MLTSWASLVTHFTRSTLHNDQLRDIQLHLCSSREVAEESSNMKARNDTR